jgi:signal recognition particle subunit SRP54
MASTLSERLSRLVKTMRGQARITESNVADMLREVRLALLEADVALPVVRDFIARVKDKALGQQVVGSLNPGQALVGIVHKELAATMGETDAAGALKPPADIDLATQPPAVLLMAGLQGSGKTTTTAKLARHLIHKRKKKVLTVSADVYRPAAIQQLKTVTGQAGAEWFASTPEQKPRDIALAALDHARRHYFDVLIVDTAGRLAIDEALMAEIRELHAAVQPVETLFVVDAMQGQDAVNTREGLQGGAAADRRRADQARRRLARRRGAVGAAGDRRADQVRRRRARRSTASRSSTPSATPAAMLGMGDIVALVEEVQKGVDLEEAKKLAEKVKSRQGLRPERLPRPDLADEEDGRPVGPDRQAAEPARRPRPPAGRHGPRRARRAAHGGHHQFDDAARAAQARTHQGDAQAPHRRRRRRARCRRSTACSTSSSRCRR